MTYIQSAIFKDVKAVFPEFSHAETSDTLKERIATGLGTNPSRFHSVSMDGSAFDSNQHHELVRAVDVAFF